MQSNARFLVLCQSPRRAPCAVFTPLFALSSTNTHTPRDCTCRTTSRIQLKREITDAPNERSLARSRSLAVYLNDGMADISGRALFLLYTLAARREGGEERGKHNAAMALKPAAGFACDLTYISKMSVPKHKKMLQPPIGASPGELRLWRKQNGLLSEEESRADAFEHLKARSRRTRPCPSLRQQEADTSHSVGSQALNRPPRASMGGRPVLSNCASASNAPRPSNRRHSCMPSIRANAKYESIAAAGARKREITAQIR